MNVSHRLHVGPSTSEQMIVDLVVAQDEAALLGRRAQRAGAQGTGMRTIVVVER